MPRVLILLALAVAFLAGCMSQIPGGPAKPGPIAAHMWIVHLENRLDEPVFARFEPNELDAGLIEVPPGETQTHRMYVLGPDDLPMQIQILDDDRLFRSLVAAPARRYQMLADAEEDPARLILSPSDDGVAVSAAPESNATIVD